jgi:diguanylate cyclase (GGDEF)-like protein/PAS domain S-box-containing protein
VVLVAAYNRQRDVCGGAPSRTAVTVAIQIINRVLIVEDMPADGDLLVSMLQARIPKIIELKHVASMQEAEEYLAASAVDVILLDLGLPDSQGLESVRRAHGAAPHTALIVVTGTEDEALAILALQEGAEDYLIKGHIDADSLLRAVRYAFERTGLKEVLFSEKERAQVTLNSIGDGVMCSDVGGKITYLNPVAEKITGWSSANAKGQYLPDVFRIRDGESHESLPALMARAIKQDRSVSLPPNSMLVRYDGDEIPIADSIAPIHDREGLATGAVIVFRDVSEVRALTQQMIHASQHDFLTGLPNRTLLADRVGQAITLAPRYGKKVAVLFLDLDGFKHVNDSLGHTIGDKLLQSVAKRLTDCVRGSDTVSRQGGDEFVALLAGIDHAEDAGLTARRMLKAVAAPHSIDGHELHITTSIGVSVCPEDALDAESLMKNADTAMYQAKEKGRQQFQFFKQEMNVRAVERQLIEEHLRRALERAEFSLHYQPKINLQTGAITGAEALLRWNHPTRGSVPPLDFVSVAEDCGLIMPIGAWALRRACEQCRVWLDADFPLATMAVNVSAMEFRNEDFLATVLRILGETGVGPEVLEIELTESVLMKNTASSSATIRNLRDNGVKVAIDDFGTGYSSLNYLRKYPVDTLKIDQSFVRQIEGAGDETPLITAMIAMARSLKLRVIAEGIESGAELAFLRRHKCDEGQGFYFSQPLPAREFERLFRLGVELRPLADFSTASA